MSDRLPIAPDQVQWHDGVLVDLRVSGLAEAEQQFTLVVDLYADDEDERRRYTCVGTKLSRFALSGHVDLLLDNRGPGNIDRMALQRRAGAEILLLNLFGGMIEAEAASFQLTESPT